MPRGHHTNKLSGQKTAVGNTARNHATAAAQNAYSGNNRLFCRADLAEEANPPLPPAGGTEAAGSRASVKADRPPTGMRSGRLPYCRSGMVVGLPISAIPTTRTFAGSALLALRDTACS